MGLDQYLYADKYISRKDTLNFDWNSGEEPPTNPMFDSIAKTLKVEKLIDNEWSGITVSVPIGYWRKANQIHGWIVDNCAGGVDECQKIYIPRSKAEELVSICKEVIKDKSKARDLLKPREGFFFGGDQIDSWYIDQLKHTVKVFEKAIKAGDNGDIESITYQASW